MRVAIVFLACVTALHFGVELSFLDRALVSAFLLVSLAQDFNELMK